MKPQLLKIAGETTHSFRARQDKQCNINSRWHYHPEVEMIHFHKGSGTQFVGDSITRFTAGDIVLIGSNLPHHWKFDESEADEADPRPYSTVIHFFDDLLGDTFMNLPENKIIKTTLDHASRGFQVVGGARQHIGELMQDILITDGPKKILALIALLIAVAECTEKRPLSSLGFSPNFEEADKDRIHSIYEYSLTNFKNKIPLEDIAEIANLSPNSFCRYFKLKTRKTYSQFINEIRIGHACKLLIENKINVKQICYESGFNNFSSFHAIFKSVTGKTPLHYQHKYLVTADSLKTALAR